MDSTHTWDVSRLEQFPGSEVVTIRVLNDVPLLQVPIVSRVWKTGWLVFLFAVHFEGGVLLIGMPSKRKPSEALHR